MSSTRRSYRVAERIREIIAEAVLRSDDSRLELTTITSVRLSKDLRNAKIYWTVAGDPDRRRSAENGFRDSAKDLRHTLAGSLGTRFVPEIRFFYDDTLDTAEHVEKLLRSVSSED